ncbi:MAG: hypothetical protein GY835_16065 [bacterium]|nr:hypothetical protein [bacterium]
MSTRLLDDESIKHIRERFKLLSRPVDVTLLTGQENEEACEFTRQFLTELIEVDDRITLTQGRLGDDDRAAGLTSPALLIGRDLGYAIEFLGAPNGIEAGTLIETLILVAGGEHGLREESVAQLATLTNPVTLHSLGTPTCPHCPTSILLNYRLAVAAPDFVRAIGVNVVDNMDLARRFNVKSVPQQVINGDPESITIGTQAEADYVTQVLEFSTRTSTTREGDIDGE